MSASTPGSTSQGGDLDRSSLLVRVMNMVSRICLMIAGMALVVIVIINGVNVYSRYVLFWALSWAEEAMVLLMILGVFSGAITVTWERIHIRIDALIEFLGEKWRTAAEWLAVLLTASVLMPMGWVSLGVVRKLYEFEQLSDALHMPVWIPQSTIPFALLCIPVVMALAQFAARRR
jgi:TRAP-type C4-dicarboxylate transport system permease small subunit